MAKLKMMIIRITEDQRNILEAKARASGFTSMAEYARSVIFRPISTEEKINKIYEKVCKNGK